MTSENPESPLQALLEASANSPLIEADPKSLDELMSRWQTTFNMNPLDLSDEDIATNVIYYWRARRSQFAKLAKEKELRDADKPKRGQKKPSISQIEL